MIGGFKGGGEREAARVFAERLSYERSTLGQVRPRGFIPPPRRKRQKDHAWVLAQALADLWGRPVLDILEYDDGTARGGTQKSRAADLRHERRFRPREAFDSSARGAGTLVFVDDVVTSGATAMAAYMALEDPSRFEVWTLVDRPKLATGTGF
jgi:predicted amidophosphoribosyltransferase